MRRDCGVIEKPEKIEILDKGILYVHVQTEKITFVTSKIPPGGNMVIGCHQEGDECYYVVSGILTVLLPDTKIVHEVKAGEVFFIPAGVKHQQWNFGTEAVVVVGAVAPSP